MTNMRRGFTMIELIFVIVIIGILAAVAIPKLQGVSEDAEVAKIQAYAGSLTRSVMPGVWSRSLVDGKDGKVEDYNSQIKRDMPAPEGLSTPSFVAANLMDANISFVNNTTAPTKTVTSETVGGKTYQVACTNGDKTHSPVCDVWNGSIYLLADKLQ